MFQLNIPKEMTNEMSSSEVYLSYLNSIVPKTRKLLDMVAPYTQHATNLNEYLTSLQQYFIEKEKRIVKYNSIVENLEKIL